MKIDTSFQITDRQFIFILIGGATGAGILSLPRLATQEALQDGWISVFISALVPLISLLLIERLCRIYPKYSLSEITDKLFGKFVGRIFTLGYIAYTILIVSTSIRVFVEITSLYILQRTPTPVILCIYVIFIIYTIMNGSTLVGRFNELVFYLLPVSLLLILPSFTASTYTNLLPIGEAGLINILKACFALSYSYSRTELIFVYYPMLKQKTRVVRDGVIALGIITFVNVFITIASIVIFGTEVLQKIIWPFILLYKIVDIPVIERLDLFFLILWTAIAARPSINYSFVSSYSITQFLNLKLEKHFSAVSITTGIIIFVVALIPKNVQQVFNIITYLGYGYFIAGIGYPIIFLLASLFLKGRTTKK